MKNSYCTLLRSIGNIAFLVLAAVLTLTTVTACVLPAGGEEQIEEIVNEFDVSSTADLAVDIFAGTVELEGIEGATSIQITAEIHDSDRVEFSVTQKGETVQVIAKQRERVFGLRRKVEGRVNLRIRMPAQAEVKIRTIVGDIDTRRIRGQSELRTVVGDISVADGGGEFELIAVTGGIQFAGEFDDQSDNRFSTVTGDIEVSLVGAPNVDLQFETTIGKILFGQSISDVEVSGKRGNLSVTMGSGAADLSLVTITGDIHIE